MAKTVEALLEGIQLVGAEQREVAVAVRTLSPVMADDGDTSSSSDKK